MRDERIQPKQLVLRRRHSCLKKTTTTTTKTATTTSMQPSCQSPRLKRTKQFTSPRRQPNNRNLKWVTICILFYIIQLLITVAQSQQCGKDANDQLCTRPGDCCSEWGWCSTGDGFCGKGCQSGECYPTPAPSISPYPTSSAPPSLPYVSNAPFATNDCETYRNTVNFGYYASWATYRWCNPTPPNDIDVQKFGYTHLAYSFAGITSDGKLEAYYGNTGDYPQYALFNSLKKDNPGLKTLIAVGGWTFDQTRFVKAANDAGRRKVFAKSVVQFLETHNFDGIDIDWEYPVTRAGTPEDYDNYPLLCKALRDEFNRAGHTDWVISVASTINPESLALGFDVVNMATWIDFFNIMSYDIHGAWDEHAGALADVPYITHTIEYMLNLGVPPSKMVYGMAAYGRSTKLSSHTCTTNGCPIKGAGLTGCPGEPGFIPYFELMEMEAWFEDPNYIANSNYTNNTLTTNYNTGTMEMVLMNQDGDLTFTSYDSTETFNMKYQYMFEKCMRGIMWWAVDMILEPIELIEGPAPSAGPSTSSAPSTSSRPSTIPTSSLAPSTSPYPTTTPSEAPSQSPTDVCSVCPPDATGMYPTRDCLGFRQCKGGVELSVTPCPGTLLFDTTLNQCNWAYNVDVCICESNYVGPPRTPAPTRVPTKKPTSKPTTPIPTKVPTPKPTAKVTAKPTTTGGMICGACPGGMYDTLQSLDCTGYYQCYDGKVWGSFIQCPPGRLFDQNTKLCKLEADVTCDCVPTTPIPTYAPSAATDMCGICPDAEWDVIPSFDCTGFYQCYDGIIWGDYTPCPPGRLFNKDTQLCEYDEQVTCECSRVPTTSSPTKKPTAAPIPVPTLAPTTSKPTAAPIPVPTLAPTTSKPTAAPTSAPTLAPTTSKPTAAPTSAPTLAPTTSKPTAKPTSGPTLAPTTSKPTAKPSSKPSSEPSMYPSAFPSQSPTPDMCGVCPSNGGWGMLGSNGCTGFFQCVNGDTFGGFNPCPPNTLFDITIYQCNHAAAVICDCITGSLPDTDTPLMRTRRK